MPITRRTALGGVAGAIAAGALGGRRARAQAGPIGIGIITPLSTPAQLYGNLLKTGIDIGVAEINARGGIGGRMVEARYFDDKADPNQSVAGFRELNGDGVKLYIQGPLSGTMLATLPIMAEAGALMVGPAGNMSLTHEAFVPNYFRPMANNYVAFRGAARAAATRYPDVTKWASIMTEGAAQRALVDYFYKGLVADYKAMHGKDVDLVDPIASKAGAGDYRNQLAIVAASGATGLINSVLGADNITLYKQAKQMGVDQSIQIFVDGAGPELQIAKAMGKATPKIMAGVAWNAQATQDNPVSKAFVEKVVAATGDANPPYWVGMGYDSVVAIGAALEGTGGDTGDIGAVIAAMEGGQPMGVAGPIVFRKEDHQALRNHYYISFSGDDSAAGWSITDISVIDGAEVVEPASPGVAFVNG